MMRRVTALLAALMLLLSGCGRKTDRQDNFTIACTTYPVYLLANSIAGNIDGVEVTLVINQQVSCLHDYTLTVSDMKTLEAADVVAINGAGLEDFLGDVLEGKQIIDCAEGIELMDFEQEHPHDEQANEEHEHHHDGADPHIWMDPRNYADMADYLAWGLSRLDPEHEREYLTQGEVASAGLERFYEDLRDSEAGQAINGLSIITFHDGFGYFADAFGLEIAASIEEEEGAEASAKDLKETIAIVREKDLPAVFTEVNGSSNAAGIIAQECGVKVGTLSMCMSGEDGDTIAAYETALRGNVETIMEAYQ